MQKAPFLVGRYIHWQACIFQISDYPSSGQVRLEHFLTRRTYAVELETLRQALSTGSLLIGVGIEQTSDKANELDKVERSRGETSSSQSDVVITYLPILNVESFFTASQPPSKKRQCFIRDRQTCPPLKTRRGGKKKRTSSVRYYQPSESAPLENPAFPALPVALSAGESSNTAQEQAMVEEIKCALQGPGKITIRWFNGRKTNLLDLYPPKPLAEGKTLHSLAAFDYEVDHQIYDLKTANHQGFERPTYTTIIDN